MAKQIEIITLALTLLVFAYGWQDRAGAGSTKDGHVGMAVVADASPACPGNGKNLSSGSLAPSPDEGRLKAAAGVNSAASAPVLPAVKSPRRPAPSLDILLDAIRQVESGGDPSAVGDNGRSLGAYQIGEAYWQDACEYGGVTWAYESGVYDDAKCRQVIRWYWRRYGAQTDEQRARMHNGGPQGHRKRATVAYWQKVKAEL